MKIKIILFISFFSLISSNCSSQKRQKIDTSYEDFKIEVKMFGEEQVICFRYGRTALHF